MTVNLQLPLPNDEFDGGIVIASVWGNDDASATSPLWALLLLLMPEPPFYRVVEIEESVDRVADWHADPLTDHSYPNIVPAVEAYKQNGGDF